ncbi:MAG: VOC family protein [Anaerolineae bacterium]|nr:VOC family protein [Anaerolineae bacterium]
MVIVTPSFNFDGCCEEAMRLYEKAFDTKIDFMMRYSDADSRDWSTPLRDEQKNWVYHAEMHIGDQRIFFSDIVAFDVAKGTALSLAITFEDAESVKRAYAVLREGSTLIYPMKSTTYSSCIVALVDRFGIRWGLLTEQTER